MNFPTFYHVTHLMQAAWCFVVVKMERHISSRHASGPTISTHPDCRHLAGVGEVGRGRVNSNKPSSQIVKSKKIEDACRSDIPKVHQMKAFGRLVKDRPQLRQMSEWR